MEVSSATNSSSVASYASVASGSVTSIFSGSATNSASKAIVTCTFSNSLDASTA